MVAGRTLSLNLCIGIFLVIVAGKEKMAFFVLYVSVCGKCSLSLRFKTKKKLSDFFVSCFFFLSCCTFFYSVFFFPSITSAPLDVMNENRLAVVLRACRLFFFLSSSTRKQKNNLIVVSSTSSFFFPPPLHSPGGSLLTLAKSQFSFCGCFLFFFIYAC